MAYLKVRWKHARAQYPVWLFSELDEARWEVRKVDVYEDGRADHADAQGAARGTRLVQEPVPSLAETAADPQFEVTEVGRDEFEHVWAAQHGRAVS